MKGIFLLLGSNMGDKQLNIQNAIQSLVDADLVLVDYSSVYETAPWGNENQDWFLNLVIRIDTMLAPNDLLKRCQEVEKDLGRERIEKWGARIIDIDILYYDNLEENKPDLTLPHPAIAQRRFTLLPLIEIAANETHPTLLKTQSQLLTACTDELTCNKLDLDLGL
ncbi:MAG: 2-amino-4-hydroxy-6-hydroxymethyldihydropteridine diphosphokinase [Cyclobacteriaceae bacterium]